MTDWKIELQDILASRAQQRAQDTEQMVKHAGKFSSLVVPALYDIQSALQEANKIVQIQKTTRDTGRRLIIMRNPEASDFSYEIRVEQGPRDRFTKIVTRYTIEGRENQEATSFQFTSASDIIQDFLREYRKYP